MVVVMGLSYPLPASGERESRAAWSSEQTKSPAGHRRKEGDLVGAIDSRVGAHVVAIDRGADHFRIFEGVGVALAALGEPGDQFADGRYACRRIDLLLCQAYALAHPGEIQKLHASSRVRWCTPACK